MALPKVGIQLVVQDIAKFSRDMDNVTKSLEKTSKSFESLAYTASGAGATKLASGFMGIATAVEAIAGPVGIAIAVIQGLMVMFEKLTAPIKKAWNAVKEFVAELGEKAWNVIKTFAGKVFDFLNPLPEIFDVIKRAASIAFGVLIRDTLRSFGDMLGNVAKGALEAASNFQLLEIRLRGIALRDLMNVDVTKTIFKPPTSEERLALINYTESMANLVAQLDETQRAYDESVQSSGKFSKQSLELEIKLRGLTGQVEQTRKEINRLTVDENGMIKSTVIQTDSTVNFAEAQKQASKEAKELLLWVSRLAIQSPFSTQDVANAFTMAKGFGLNTQMAKESTAAVMNFAAGMGLTGDQMERILINFGQMWTQGKVTGTELRDLARGSLVPTTRIFELLGRKIGKTAAEMRALATKGKVSVKDFINAFNEMAMQDFPDAAKNMTRTLAGLKEKLTDFGQTYFGMFLIKPGLDIVTGRLSDLFDLFMGNEAFLLSIEAVGRAFGRLMDSIFKPNINADTVTKVTKFLFDLVYLIDYITTRDTEKFKEKLIAMGVPEWIVNSVENLYNAWKNFSNFFEEIKGTLVNAINTVLTALGIKVDTNGILGFTEDIETLSKYLDDHAGGIASQIQIIADKIAAFIQIVKFGYSGDQQVTLGKGTIVSDDIASLGSLEKVALIVYELKTKLGEMLTSTQNLISFSKDLFGIYATANSSNVSSIAKSLERIRDVFSAGKGGVNLVNMHNLELFFGTLGSGIMGAAAANLEAMATGFEKIKAAWDEFQKNPIEGSFGRMLMKIFWYANYYLGPIGVVVRMVSGFIDGIKKFFEQLKKDLVGESIIPEMFTAIETAFKNFFSPTGLLATISTWVTDVTTKFTGLKDDVMTAVKTMVNDVVNKFTSNFKIPDGTIWTTISTFIQKVIGLFQDMWDDIVGNSIIPDMMDDIEEEMVGGFAGTVRKTNSLVSKFLGDMQSMSNFATGAYNKSTVINNSYNVDFDANYSRTQSASSVQYDLEALLAAVAR